MLSTSGPPLTPTWACCAELKTRSLFHNPAFLISSSWSVNCCLIAPYMVGAPFVSSLVPGQDHLARLARLHDGEALLEVPEVVVVGDDGVDVQAGLEHDGHLVPGLV